MSITRPPVPPTDRIFGGDHPVVICGAGRMGVSFLRELRRAGVEPVAFADQRATIPTQKLEGLPVLSVADILFLYGPERPLMLVASLLAEYEITRKLGECEF